MSELVLTVGDLKKFYSRKPLFSNELIMTFMRKFNGNFDIIKHIYLFVIFDKFRKFYYDDIFKYSYIILSLSNAIICEEAKFECFDSFTNFSCDNLSLIGDVIIELLSHYLSNCCISHYCEVNNDCYIVKICYLSRVRFFKISFFKGRKTKNPLYLRNNFSNRCVMTTFNLVKSVGKYKN